MRKENIWDSPAQSIDFNFGEADSQLHLELPFYLDNRENKRILTHKQKTAFLYHGGRAWLKLPYASVPTNQA